MITYKAIYICKELKKETVVFYNDKQDALNDAKIILSMPHYKTHIDDVKIMEVKNDE